MNIAIVISGLVRFPEQGFTFLEEILKRSPHKIDIYAGVWSTDTVPESITKKLKGIATVPYSLRTELLDLLKDHELFVGLLSDGFIEQHAGLISHMGACTAFSNELKDYDLIIKWRWDVAILPDHFDIICKTHNLTKNSFITDVVMISDGVPVMNEVVFSASPKLMLEAYTPVKERFLRLGKILDLDFQRMGAELRTGSFDSFTRLIIDKRMNVRSANFNWALLRKNILDNLGYLYCNDPLMLKKLQRDFDLERDRLLLENSKNNK
jgi:hypothetical protein